MFTILDLFLFTILSNILLVTQCLLYLAEYSLFYFSIDFNKYEINNMLLKLEYAKWYSVSSVYSNFWKHIKNSLSMCGKIKSYIRAASIMYHKHNALCRSIVSCYAYKILARKYCSRRSTWVKSTSAFKAETYYRRVRLLQPTIFAWCSKQIQV